MVCQSTVTSGKSWLDTVCARVKPDIVISNLDVERLKDSPHGNLFSELVGLGVMVLIHTRMPPGEWVVVTPLGEKCLKRIVIKYNIPHVVTLM